MLEGFRFLPEYFPPPAQKALASVILSILERNPLYRGAMPRTGKPLSVRNTNLGQLGWVSDIKGYRYQPTHPETREAWTPIPETLLDLWKDVSGYPHPPQACLVNWYEADSRLGLHVDADETAKDAPVVSVSLGSRALFRLGGSRPPEWCKLGRPSSVPAQAARGASIGVAGGGARANLSASSSMVLTPANASIDR